ncbi:MAG: hypothetical protein KDA84_20490, partial [Planctomycetaceae bacterium]|nr:hypothetical protein [Planctomycetaceae bacterium]
MAVSMISCPSCRTMLFTDTIVCPACRHVLDKDRAAMVDNDDLGSRSEQIPCRSCGEANQIGLVRCWNCSAFLREDIQEAYYKMLRGEREVIYSQPNDRRTTEPEPELPSPNQTKGDLIGDDDDDFELSDSHSLTSPSQASANQE